MGGWRDGYGAWLGCGRGRRVEGAGGRGGGGAGGRGLRALGCLLLAIVVARCGLWCDALSLCCRGLRVDGSVGVDWNWRHGALVAESGSRMRIVGCVITSTVSMSEGKLWREGVSGFCTPPSVQS